MANLGLFVVYVLFAVLMDFFIVLKFRFSSCKIKGYACSFSLETALMKYKPSSLVKHRIFSKFHNCI